ncbi:MAG: D-alanyl-D-alanine carboxypeptidase/D-alanyl-D-alanine-endopeptidase [Methylophilus sp.]|nr:D-alanyl-D-alanine carboxypeptidase/D-alanyl-D-alanine-endopeptidase [Methylophilus sp.]
MKKLLILLSLVSNVAFAQLPQTLIEALKQADIPQDSVAVYVQSVDGAAPSFSHNASKAMNAASVMKLVTTYTALEALTPAYRWKTEVYREGELRRGVLNGNLMIKGYGDPSFKAQDFWRLLMSLQQAGVREIKGDLVIDKSLFAKELSARSTFDDEIWRAYNALPSAFLVNGRSTSFKFSVEDGMVVVNQEFELPQVRIVNNMKPTLGACADWRNYFRYNVNPKTEGVTVIFNGTYSVGCEERYLELSVLSDEQYAFYTFKKLWKEIGGKFSGKLQVREIPLTALKVLEQHSEPLGYVVRDINKWSNNLMARQLLLAMAIEKNSTLANEEDGSAVVKQVLSNKGLRFSELVIENGAGLSRIERISAEHLGQMLTTAYNSAVMPEFIASLPILALDGTVKKRLEYSAMQGNAHLKTGSLDGVSAVAGYVLDQHKRRYVLVMLVNHAKAAASKGVQDALIQAVYFQ